MYQDVSTPENKANVLSMIIEQKDSIIAVLNKIIITLLNKIIFWF